MVVVISWFLSYILLVLVLVYLYERYYNYRYSNKDECHVLYQLMIYLSIYLYSRCDKEFRNEFSMRRHERNDGWHKKNLTTDCNYCDKKFSTQRKKDSHQENCHRTGDAENKSHKGWIHTRRITSTWLSRGV